jgi:hemerythrin
MTVHLLQFLKDWLENHIMVSDFEYAPCLKQKNVA